MLISRKVVGSSLKVDTKLVMLIPSMLLILLFSYYPAIRSIIGSLTQWNGFSNPSFVGLENFKEYFTTSTTLIEFRNLLILSVVGMFTGIVFPFLGAELVYHIKSIRVQNVTKYLLAIPIVVPPIVLISIWANILNPNDGLLDTALSLLRIPAVQWLSNPHTALLGILMLGFPWVSTLGFLIFLAGLQNIPKEVTEAMELDGAHGIRRVFILDVPLTMPQIQFVIVIHGITLIQNFIPILLLTNGGPGNATLVPGLDMYDTAFQNNQLGMGMAIGTVLFFVLVLITSAFLFLFRSRE